MLSRQGEAEPHGRQPKDILAGMAHLQLHCQVHKEDCALWHPGAAGLLFAHHHYTQLGQIQQETNGLCHLQAVIQQVKRQFSSRCMQSSNGDLPRFSQIFIQADWTGPGAVRTVKKKLDTKFDTQKMP